MHRSLPLALLLVLAACATEPDVPSPEGTENPLAETPVEAPADTLDVQPDSADVLLDSTGAGG